eukprot:TRINITY_DN13212_c0_g1_i1.p1 TRINITY_DN13212_c0_g1~~TRINITY_DN13212_c0_g1_i1.p1  ORF type:complete len:254 (-),score=-2.42 TRINITY_DN13212_c0_g1_i1:157-918(-)
MADAGGVAIGHQPQQHHQPQQDRQGIGDNQSDAETNDGDAATKVYLVKEALQRRFEGFAAFKLTADGCALVLSSGDLTAWHINGRSDAIVNVSNEPMRVGGGVDAAVHKAAGPDLLRLCQAMPQVRPNVRCPACSAVATRACNLPVSTIVHTVPTFFRSEEQSLPLLERLYRSVMAEARRCHVQQIAIPAIGCGVYQYPPGKAAETAIRTLQAAARGLEEVHFVFFSNDVMDAWMAAAFQLLDPLQVVMEYVE